MSIQLEILAAPEAQRLAELEAIVAKGAETYIEVGNALLAIRDERLYRQTHTRFGDYLRERWDMGRRRGYQLIDAAKTAAILVDGDEPCEPRYTRDAPERPKLPLPKNERVVRRLLQTAERDENRAVEIWAATVEQFGEDATPDQVAQAAAGVDATPRDVPFETAAIAQDLRRGAAAMLRAHKTKDPRDARRALAVLRDAEKRLPAEYERLDGLAR